MGVKNPWEPVQTFSNTQTPRLKRELHVKNGDGDAVHPYGLLHSVWHAAPLK